MKKYFRILALALALVLAFSVAACKKTGDTPDSSPTPTGGEPAVSPTQPAAADPDLTVIIVTSGSTIDDGSFNQDNYNGIEDYAKKTSLNIAYNDVKSESIEFSETDVKAVVGDYDVVVLPGYQFGGAFLAPLAQDNPETKFILVDSYPEGADDGVANIYAMQFKEQESGFFAGVAAALQTKTGYVAVVNGIAYPSNVNYQWGFYAGVNYSNAHYGTAAQYVELPSYSGYDVRDINVGGNYASDFGDPVIGKQIADELINNHNVDIIFAAAGYTGTGVFTSVKEHPGTFVIGVDTDQWADGANGSSNVVLTSVLKNMRINITRQLEAIENGTFKGGNYLLGADTDSTGYVSEEGHHQLTADTLSKLSELYGKVKSGEIEPPSNFSESTFVNFKGL